MKDKKYVIAIAALILGVINTALIVGLYQRKPKIISAPAPPIVNNSQVAAPPAPSQPATIVPPQESNPQPPAQQGTTAVTAIKFDKMEHNFGVVKQESENKYEFSFTNIGKEPLVIADAKGSCGCTVPDYPKEPIMPGKKGKIKVVYSPGQQIGSQTKNVTVTANTEPPQTVLTIKAEVKEK
jgi:hypothetical protein